MGVSIHYRGKLTDFDRLEDLEDRVIDLALELGGNVRIWRSSDEGDPSRMVRGVMLELAPGQETTPLLFSPEGFLMNLPEIEDAEQGKLIEPPWCSVKTQFGPIEGHVALVHLLAAVKSQFIPDLEVTDEGGYWEHRNFDELKQKFAFVGSAIRALDNAIRQDGLSAEASEDSEILMTRVERLAKVVHRTMTGPNEHPPVSFPEDELGLPIDTAENEAHWDALYRENRRRQERMQRILEERTTAGENPGEAFDAAIDELIRPIFETDDLADHQDAEQLFTPQTDDAENWKNDGDEEQEGDPLAESEKDPLQQQAMNLLLGLYDFTKKLDAGSAAVDMLMGGMGDVCGGFAQVLPLPPYYEMDDAEQGLALVQLKRALRGASFAQGALFLLRSDNSIDQTTFDRISTELDQIRTEIVEKLRTVRAAGAD